MRTSSTRRLGAASLITLLALFTFTAPALAGGKSEDRAAKGGAEKTERPSVSGSEDDDSKPDTSTEKAQPDGDNMHPSGNDRHEDKGTQGHSMSDPDGAENGGADKPFVGGDGTGGVDREDQDGNNGCGNDDDFEDDNNGNCGGKVKASGENPPVVLPECVDNKDTPKNECDDDECVDKTETTEDECDKTEVRNEVIKKCPEVGATVGSTTEMKDGCLVTTPTKTVTAETLATGAVAGTALDTPASVLGVQLERTAPAAVAAGAATAPAGTSVLGAALARTGLSFTVLALAIALGLLAVGFALKRAGRTQSDF